MWTLENMPLEAAVHLPKDTSAYSKSNFRKARGVNAVQVYRHRQPVGIYFCNRMSILFMGRQDGYRLTPYEVETPDGPAWSVCFPTLKRAVEYIQENYGA